MARKNRRIDARPVAQMYAKQAERDRRRARIARKSTVKSTQRIAA